MSEAKPKVAKPELPYRKILVELDIPTHEIWLACAQRRGLTVADMTGTVIDTIVNEDLLPEILGETAGA